MQKIVVLINFFTVNLIYVGAIMKKKMHSLKVALGVSPVIFSFELEYKIIINMLKLNNFPNYSSNKIIIQPLSFSSINAPFARRSDCLHICLHNEVCFVPNI